MKRSGEIKRTKPMRQRKPMVKGMGSKMTAARKGAQGRPCTIRIPCRCEPNPETTVLAHYRLGTGGGQKPDDEQAADACFICHEIVDGRMAAPEFTKDQIRLWHAEGVLRTQEARRQEAA